MAQQLAREGARCRGRAIRRRKGWRTPGGAGPLGAFVLGAAVLAGPAAGQCQYQVTAVLEYPFTCSSSIVQTFGSARNDHGTVVGWWKCPLWDYSEAFVWTAEDGFTTLPRPSGTRGAGAADINNDGVICGTVVFNDVGYRGFVYENGEWTILPTVTGAGWSSTVGINDAGQVAGTRSIAGGITPHNAECEGKPPADRAVVGGPASFYALTTVMSMLFV